MVASAVDNRTGTGRKGEREERGLGDGRRVAGADGDRAAVRCPLGGGIEISGQLGRVVFMIRMAGCGGVVLRTGAAGGQGDESNPVMRPPPHCSVMLRWVGVTSRDLNWAFR